MASAFAQVRRRLRDAMPERGTRGAAEPASAPPATALAPARERADVVGVLDAVALRPRSEFVPAVVARLRDDTGDEVDLVWLGRRSIAGLEAGVRLAAHGRLTTLKARPTIYNPTYELLP